MEREEKADKQPETAVATGDGTSDPKKAGKKPNKTSRSRSRRRAVSYDGGTADQNDDQDTDTSATELLRRRKEQDQTSSSADRTTDSVDPTFLTLTHSPKAVTFSSDENQPPPVPVNDKNQNRPAADGKLFPFKLAKSLGDEGANPSTVTLKSYAGVTTPRCDDEAWKKLVDGDAGGELIDSNRSEGEETRGGEGSTRPDLERFETAREGL